MYILIKVIDVYKSKLYRGKTVGEYIIYIMIGETKIEAYTEFGIISLQDKVDELKKIKGINDVFFEKN